MSESARQHKPAPGRESPDLTGRRFTRLVPLERVFEGRWKWRCICDCGEVSIVNGYSLESGHTRSCGCLARELTASLTAKHLNARKGKTTRVYQIWHNMRRRCLDPGDKRFKQYGGRGIRVCERWADFSNFLLDMGQPPTGTSLGRINNDGDYEPSNCRWSTNREQCRNKSNNHLVTVGGATRTLVEWQEISGLSTTTIARRIRRGVSPEEAMSLPRQPGRRLPPPPSDPSKDGGT